MHWRISLKSQKMAEICLPRSLSQLSSTVWTLFLDICTTISTSEIGSATVCLGEFKGWMLSGGYRTISGLVRSHLGRPVTIRQRSRGICMVGELGELPPTAGGQGRGHTQWVSASCQGAQRNLEANPEWLSRQVWMSQSPTFKLRYRNFVWIEQDTFIN